MQLELGIRYFDIRLVAIVDENTSSKKEYHILHCLVGSRIVTILQALKNWMCLNEEEVIILDFQHCYRFEEEDYKEIVDIIMTEFPGKLCPWTKFKILTLDFMVKSGNKEDYYHLEFQGHQRFHLILTLILIEFCQFFIFLTVF